MEENNSNKATSHHLCKQGCGFYASSQFQDMCSKCFTDQQALHPPPASPTAKTGVVVPPPPATNGTSTSPVSTSTPCSPRNTLPTSPPSLPSLKRRLPSSPSLTPPEQVTPSDSPNRAMSEDRSDSLGLSPPGLVSSTSHAHSAPCSVRGEAPSPSPSDSVSSSPGSQRKQLNRCLHCRKRVGLTGLRCRCGGTFCSMHRYSDKHNCAFDYQSQGQQDIRKSNPQITASKIKKI